LCLIDFEVAHFGDPTYDPAFLIAHLLLKRFHLPNKRDEIAGIAQAFWRELCDEIPWQALSFFKRGTFQHLGPLLLARVDGKSPAEYLVDESLRQQVRAKATQMILQLPTSLEECLAPGNI
jgi:hypothetical protein